MVSSQYGWSTNMERIMKAQTMGAQDKEAIDSVNTLFDVALIGTGLTPADPNEFAARLQTLLRLGLGVSKDAPIEEPEVTLDPPKEEEKKEDKAEEKKEPAEEKKEL